MKLFQTKPPEDGVPGPRASETPADPRLTPTPDYGTLGPDSDFAKTSKAALPGARSSNGVPDSSRRTVSVRMLQIVAVLAGAVSALVVSGVGRPRGVLGRMTGASTTQKRYGRPLAKTSEAGLDRQPQRQAEMLLTRAVSRSEGATEEIQAHVDSWRGKIQWNPQLSQLTTAALNSNDEKVRTSGVEVQLAAYGLAKSDSTVESLVQQAESSDHAQRIWALWSLGLLGNRGVAADRVVDVLTRHLKGTARDSDEDSRRWAVEGLALVGTDATIAALLDVMHNDPSALVRERAACSLAESGMLTHEQRLTAVPQLINYSDDSALDAQTHAWAFQALGDITKQRLPNDSAAWRSWYQAAGGQ